MGTQKIKIIQVVQCMVPSGSRAPTTGRTDGMEQRNGAARSKMAGVSGVSLLNTIQSEIDRARQDLKGVDENLRRLTGRDFNDPK